jgi:hypothetical protein
MKKVKIGFWLILIAFLVLVGYQNKAFFLQRHSFDINVWVTAPYKTAEIYNAVLFGACFVAGLVLAYLSSLFERFKANKTIKQLTATLSDQKTQMEQLRTEIDALKNVSTQVTTPVPDEPQAEDEDTVSASAAG